MHGPRLIGNRRACLALDGTFAIPPTFLLSISGQPPMACKAIWRTNARIGVRFV